MIQDEAIVNFTRFTQLVDKFVTDKSKIDQKDIDCVFVMLIQSGELDVSAQSEAALAEKTKGFESQAIALLFEGIDIDEISSVNQSKDLDSGQ